MFANNDLRKLADKLQRRWFELRVLQPIVIAQQGDYTLYVNRKGNLCLSHYEHTSNTVDELYSHKNLFVCTDDPELREEFDDAIALTGCTAQHLLDARKRLWQERRPRVVAYYLFVRSKARRAMYLLKICWWKLKRKTSTTA